VKVERAGGVWRWLRGGLSITALSATSALVTSCVSVGEGEGFVQSEQLNAPECWDAKYALAPDFFAAEPFRDTMQIRVQRGSDLKEVSDGVTILVTSIEGVRARLGEPIEVGLPQGVSPPGVPVGCDGAACPERLVNLALYLHQSCHNQNMVLYATEGTITFEELFSGDPNEDDAAEKLTVARFDVLVGDPRMLANPDVDPATVQSRLTGYFRFFFQRGQPAQPFP
jgi:hypothetical protein